MQPLRLKKCPPVTILLVFVFLVLGRVLYLFSTDGKAPAKPPVTWSHEAWFREAFKVARKDRVHSKNVIGKARSEISKPKAVQVVVVEEHHEGEEINSDRTHVGH